MSYYETDDGEKGYVNMPFSTPMNTFNTSILQLTNPENELIKLELTLRSQILNTDGKPIQTGNPLLNEEGINSVIGQVQSIINQVTVMSNFESKDLPPMIDFLGDTLSKDLMLNRDKYNIRNASARDKIFFAVCIGAYIVMKRALNNGERGFWKGSQQDIRQIIDTGQKSKGLFGALGWGNKTH